ncbi:MAG TPA: hypothetical protein VGT60_13610 [Candidatus Limnocylindria bacterium]|nr:hypothetical protein [Candidatus Limnocylindria bacterium]
MLTARLADAACAAGRDLFGRRAGRDVAGARRVAAWRRRRRELIDLRRRLSSEDALPFFSFDVHFGGVLAQGGFDLVVGNPPWVRGERVSAGTRAMLERRYRSFRAAAPGRRGFSHLPDLSVAFVERALQLARPRGVVGFVLPAKLLRAGYAAPLRTLLRDSATIIHIEDRSHAAASGFAATVFPMLCALRREPPDQDAPATVLTSTVDGEIGGLTTQRDLQLDVELRGAPWLVLPRETACVIRRVLQAGPRLTSLFKPRLGVKTGSNETFVRSNDQADELPVVCRVPAIQGRDIRPFAIVPSAWLLAALDDQGNPLRDVDPAVAAYIAVHRASLARRADARRGPPWSLFRTDLLRSRWLVIWRDIAGRLEAAALERRSRADPVPLNTCYGVSVPDEFAACWLSAWLNSAPMRAAAVALAERASGGAFRFSATAVGQLPVPTRTDGSLVRSIAAIGGAAKRGQDWSQHDLDAYVLASLGLEENVAGALGRLDSALRRNAGRDC